MEIKYVCSLGISCNSAFFLKRNDLKKASYPFDWILCDISIVKHCIQNEFVDFLDKQYYLDVSEKRCTHTKYREELFYHYNPLRNPQDYVYYTNCVSRFKDLIKKTENKLFIISFINQTDDLETIKSNVIEFNEYLKTITYNYKLLCIIHYVKKSLFNEIKNTDNIDFLELHTTTTSNGIIFSDEAETKYMDDIIKNQYQFSLNEVIPPKTPLPVKQNQVRRFKRFMM
jgi:hypothetical protein